MRIRDFTAGPVHGFTELPLLPYVAILGRYVHQSALY